MIPNRNTFQHMIRGFKRLPHCGPHPGMPLFFILIVISSIAGIQNGTISMFLGFTFSIVIYFPIIAIGSVDRSKTDDYLERKRIEEIESVLYN